MISEDYKSLILNSTELLELNSVHSGSHFTLSYYKTGWVFHDGLVTLSTSCYTNTCIELMVHMMYHRPYVS